MRISRTVRSRLTLTGVLSSAGGLALFAYYVQRAGWDEVASGVGRVGFGFIAILLLSALRYSVRAAAWTLCVEGQPALRFRDALAATVTGDALGNLTPLGTFVSEPAKAVFVSRRVPAMAAVSALAIENLLYSLTVAAVIAAGMGALLLSFEVPPALRIAGLASFAAAALIIIAALLIVLRRVPVTSLLARWISGPWRASPFAVRTLVRISALEERVYGFHERHPRLIVPALLFECAFHASSIAEVYITLLLILRDAAPTLLAAFVLETVNRVITVVFRFVPFRLGVDEAGTSLVTEVLRFGTAAGVTLAIVRKARVLVWTTVGLALLIRRSFAEPAPIETGTGLKSQGSGRAQA